MAGEFCTVQVKTNPKFLDQFKIIWKFRICSDNNDINNHKVIKYILL